MKKCFLFLLILAMPLFAQAQFYDDFNKDRINGWFFFTGDGDATMDFIPGDDFARMKIDAASDQYNVWWAIIKNDVSDYLDLSKFTNPNFELRVEARIKVSDAPRRVNFMINTQRTTNYHEHLREFYIPDTNNWYTISMTTRNLDVLPGDSLYVQFGATDWGLDKYHVDIDYYRADIVDITMVKPDKGEPLIYHPELPDLSIFTNKVPVSQDAMITPDFPDVNFNNWYVIEQHYTIPVLTVGRNQWIILRWDFNMKNPTASEAGILELTTHSLFKGGNYIQAFGKDLGEEFVKIRVIEITGGNPSWEQNSVTYNSFCADRDLEDIINGQMIFDLEVNHNKEGKNYITIPRAVMQRLLDGTTKGLMIKPLGVLTASFYASEESTGIKGPKLLFNTKK